MRAGKRELGMGKGATTTAGKGKEKGKEKERVSVPSPFSLLFTIPALVGGLCPLPLPPCPWLSRRRVTVLMGGTSAGRDVSLASGLRIADALRQRGHDVVTLDTARGTLSLKEEKHISKGTVVKTTPPSQQE